MADKNAIAPIGVHRSVAALWVEDARSCKDNADKLEAAAISFLELDDKDRPRVEHAKDLASVAASLKTVAGLRKQAAESLKVAQERHEAERLAGKGKGLQHRSPQMKALFAQKERVDREMKRLAELSDKLEEEAGEEAVRAVEAETRDADG